MGDDRRPEWLRAQPSSRAVARPIRSLSNSGRLRRSRQLQPIFKIGGQTCGDGLSTSAATQPDLRC